MNPELQTVKRVFTDNIFAFALLQLALADFLLFTASKLPSGKKLWLQTLVLSINALFCIHMQL